MPACRLRNPTSCTARSRTTVCRCNSSRIRSPAISRATRFARRMSTVAGWSGWIAICAARRDKAAQGMRNPWLEIPLEDYEGHMSHPSIGQAQMLADQALAPAAGTGIVLRGRRVRLDAIRARRPHVCRVALRIRRCGRYNEIAQASLPAGWNSLHGTAVAARRAARRVAVAVRELKFADPSQ